VIEVVPEYAYQLAQQTEAVTDLDLLAIEE
jgi:hypothetical protein